MLAIYDAVVRPRPCFGDCHRTLTLEQRTRAIEAIYHLDDALRGWGYTPTYEIFGDKLWREAQQKNDPSYRGVAVRFGECLYRRLVGSMIHECLHASFGDPTKANYGMPFGLPYTVPNEIAEKDEEAYLADFNFGEARAFAGVWVLAPARYGIDWRALNSRDYGTFCFKGGNALVPPKPGYRSVAHLDPQTHADRYIPKARALEEQGRLWFSPENYLAVVSKIDKAAALGKASRPRRYPDAKDVAAMVPEKVGRNDSCPCGSGKKVKGCCGENAKYATGASYAR